MRFIRVLDTKKGECLVNIDHIESVKRCNETKDEDIYVVSTSNFSYVGKFLGGSGAHIKTVLKVMKYLNSPKDMD